MDPTDRLEARELSHALGRNVIGHQIIVLESTRSTNDFLLQMLTPELPEGVVVFAEEQTAGRGQRGNRWASAHRLGLWFSLILRPRFSATESALLTQWAAETIVLVVRKEFQLSPVIKPPNDVYLGARKLAGVLVETKAGKGKEWSAVVGIGVNVNQAELDFPTELRAHAGSLAMALDRRIDRQRLAIALLLELERNWATISPMPAARPLSPAPGAPAHYGSKPTDSSHCR